MYCHAAGAKILYLCLLYSRECQPFTNDYKYLISTIVKFGTILFLALLTVCSRLPAFYFIITYIK